MKKKGIRVFLDNRNYSAGFKFNEWELRGVPLRIDIGPKDIQNKQVTLVERTGKKTTEKLAKLDVKKTLKKIQSEMIKKSKAMLKTSIKNMKEKKELSSLKGFARSNWCGSDECEAQIKETGSEIRGTLYKKKEKPFGKCINCGKPAKHVVYIAKAY